MGQEGTARDQVHFTSCGSSQESELYLDEIPVIATRGIEDLYKKYAEYSRTKIGKYVQSNALLVWASKNALNHMHQGRIIDTHHILILFLDFLSLY